MKVSEYLSRCSVCVEMLLNSVTFQRYHVALVLAWGLLYAIFIWSAVISTTVASWPYDFLRLDTPYCFAW